MVFISRIWYTTGVTSTNVLTGRDCDLQGLYKQMVDSFRSLGVEAVAGVGHPFDPNFHEAIMQEENDDVPDGTILQEFRKGFKCGDKLLRAAMVKVHVQLVTAFCDQQPASQAGS